MDDRAFPGWLRRAMRRRRLLALGVSLSEQMATATRELDAILAVENVAVQVENDRMERARREAEHG